MGKSPAFLSRLLRIVTAARFVAALFGSTFRGLIAGSPNRAQRLCRGPTLRTRCFFLCLFLRRITTRETVFAVRLAGDAFAIAGFAFARMEVLVLVNKDRRVKINLCFLRQGIAKLVFENGCADFLHRTFRQIIELEGAE